jgi:cytochrome b561
VLADLDGTFAVVPASDPLIHRITPTVLNVQAVIAMIAILFLTWSAWTQARRPVAIALPLRNDERQFGKVSRGFHWVIAVLMFCLVPIGLFMAILPGSLPERAGFVGAHQSLGLTVLLLVIGRIGWLIASPSPPSMVSLTPLERRASRAVHLGLYLALLAFPVSGFLLNQGARIDFYGWAIMPVGETGLSDVARAVHGWVMPILFYAMLMLHICAVLKRHFADGERSAVRRMLR